MILPADVHTHNPDPTRDALINLEARPGLIIPDRGLYSVGVHPWWADGQDTTERLDVVARLASHPRVRAIGETGLDRLRGPEMDVQQRVFETQAYIARINNKPLIIHCVRAWDTLLAIHKKFKAADVKPQIESRKYEATDEELDGENTGAEVRKPVYRLSDTNSVWIIHGFRSGASLARQLLDAGMLLSFGSHYNLAALAITPHPLFETD